MRVDDTPSELASRVLKEVCDDYLHVPILHRAFFLCHSWNQEYLALELCILSCNSDSLSHVLQEHILYSFAVSALCEDRIFWREDGVPIIRKSWDEAEYL